MTEVDNRRPSAFGTRRTVPTIRARDVKVLGRCPLFCREAWRRISSALRFTKPETDVARCLLEGKCQKQIAVALHLRTATIHRHLSRLYERLGVSSEFELVARVCREHNELLCKLGLPAGCGVYRFIAEQTRV